MLHIFWIHSHITFLISKEIIEKLGENDDILVFLSRGYSLPLRFENHKVELVSFPWYRENSSSSHNLLSKSNVFKTRMNVKQCKSLIAHYVKKRPFILYVPTSWEYTVGLLLRHNLCEGYFYIEEGSLSYLSDGNKRRNCYFRRFIANYVYNLPYLGMLAVLPHFLGTYSSSSDAFPWSRKVKHVVEFISIPNYFEEFSSINRIVIFDHLVMSNADLIDLLDSLCEYFKKNGIIKFGYKFHPITKTNPNKESIIRERFSSFDAYELPMNFIVEIFLIGKSITIYSINKNSSLLIYAKRFGNLSLIVSPDARRNDQIRITKF